METDAIKAGKHFKIDEWSPLKHAAMRLALAESACQPADEAKITKLCSRFKVGAAFAFYKQNPQLWS